MSSRSTSSRVFTRFVLPLAGVTALELPSAAGAQLRTERRTAGDTTIVRTLGTERAAAVRTTQRAFAFGSFDGPPELVFGSITSVKVGSNGTVWVFDSQVPALRQYDTTGKFIRQVGRGGMGPGEYGPLIALVLTPAGVPVVLEPQLSRVQIYDGAGKATMWRLPPTESSPRAFGGSPPSAVSFTSGGVVTDRAGAIYARITTGTRPATASDPRPVAVQGLVRFAPDGTTRDTLALPWLGTEPVLLRTASRTLPLNYGPREYWAFSPFGHLVGGRSDAYAIHIRHADGKVTRIERDIPRVPISAAERKNSIDRTTASIRAREPGWNWTGPELPRVKPYFKGVTTDDDGRIWVRLHTAGVPVVDTVAAGGRGRGGVPPSGPIEYWREDVLYEVFAPDGRYLARVTTPDFVFPPAIRGNSIWSGGVDADGVPVVVQYRIVPGIPG